MENNYRSVGSLKTNRIRFSGGPSYIGLDFFKNPTGRASDGRLISDFIAEYAKLSLILPYLQPGNHQYINGVNFASIGSGALVDTLSGLKETYKAGGRKLGFSNLINLGCLPIQRANAMASTGRLGCLKEATLLAKLHNTALSKTMKELERHLEGFKYSNFDMYNATEERIDNPSEYGFVEVDEACCGSDPYRGSLGSCGNKTGKYQLCDNVDQYFFFDGAHPTEKANDQLANLMWSGSTQYVSPYNLKTLFEEC